jgi:hypothetical protein
MRRFVGAIGLAVMVCGSTLWGHTGQSQTNSEYQSAYAEAYEKSFRAAFRSESVEQCVASAPKAAAAGYDITPTCRCAADTLLATKTVEQLTALSSDGSSAALQAVTAQCLKTNPPVLSSKP